MERVTKEVVATKMIEVYAGDHKKLKEAAERKGLTLRAYMHELAERVSEEK